MVAEGSELPRAACIVQRAWCTSCPSSPTVGVVVTTRGGQRWPGSRATGTPGLRCYHLRPHRQNQRLHTRMRLCTPQYHRLAHPHVRGRLEYRAERLPP